MSEAIAIAFGFAILALLFMGGVVVLGLGAWAWGNAIAAAHRARAHGLTADAQQVVHESARDALGEIDDRRREFGGEDYRPPADNELVEAILAARNGSTNDDRDITTIGNEGIEEEPPIPVDSQWQKP